MKGKVELRYEFLESMRVKHRVEKEEEGASFTKDVKEAVSRTVVELLNTNVLTFRLLFQKNLKELGWKAKNDNYQRHIDSESKRMLRVFFKIKKRIPRGSKSGQEG